MQSADVPETKIDQQIGLKTTVREKDGIDSGIGKAAHGSAIQAQHTGNENQIRTLHAAVAPGCHLRPFHIVGKRRLCIGIGEKLGWQVFKKVRILRTAWSLKEAEIRLRKRVKSTCSLDGSLQVT